MKYRLLLPFLFLSSFAFGQSFQAFYEVLKNDNAEKLGQILNKENMDKCYTVKGSDYCLLALCVKSNAMNCLKSLIDNGADIEKACESKSPLLYAAKYGKLEMFKVLIENGASLAKNQDGRSAKDYANKYQQKEILTYIESIENQ